MKVERGSYVDGKVKVVWTRLFCDQCGRNLSFEDRGNRQVEFVGCPCGRVFKRHEIDALIEEVTT